MSKPEKNSIPTLRWAANDANGNPYPDFIALKFPCCYKCLYFGSVPISSPKGWCALYPSQLENTSEFHVCDQFNMRTGNEIKDDLKMMKEHPENYNPGDYKLMSLGNHIMAIFKIVEANGERKCVMQMTNL